MLENDKSDEVEAEIKATLGSSGGGDYPPAGLAAGVKKLPEWIQMGCGDKPYYCEEKKATFPSDRCPDAMPDFTGYGNFMSDVLTADPEIYNRLKDRTTSSG